MDKVIVTGASGFLGSKILNRLCQRYSTVGTCLTHGRPGLVNLDITRETDVRAFFRSVNPSLVIHTVAISDVDYCQTHQDEAYRINVSGTQNIVNACETTGSRLIYTSTEYVFDGTNSPYKEGDPPNPVNYYGWSKYEAERRVQSIDNWSLLRFDFLYGYNGPGYPNGLIGKILAGGHIEASPTQMRRPLLTDDLVQAIGRIIEKGLMGIFHIIGPEKATKYDFCKMIASSLSVDMDIQAIEDSSQIAKRPKDIFLTTERADEIGVTYTSIADALKIIGEF